MADMLQALCMGCDKDEPHYKLYRSGRFVYAYCGVESVGIYDRIMCASALHYNLVTKTLVKLENTGSYRDPNEKKIKLPQEFFSLSCHEKINKLSGGVYDV